MFDPATIGSVSASVRAIVELLKSMKDSQLATKINSEMMTLQQRLIDVQQQVLSLQNENQQLHDKIRELRDTSELESNVVFINGACWHVAPEDSPSELEGPFCPGCWSDTKKLFRAPISYVADGYVVFVCDNHPHRYTFRIRENLVKDVDLRPYRQEKVNHPNPGTSSAWG